MPPRDRSARAAGLALLLAAAALAAFYVPTKQRLAGLGVPPAWTGVLALGTLALLVVAGFRLVRRGH
jgi:drug/metabolite transporter (DMT)-like permease